MLVLGHSEDRSFAPDHVLVESKSDALGRGLILSYMGKRIERG